MRKILIVLGLSLSAWAVNAQSTTLLTPDDEVPPASAPLNLTVETPPKTLSEEVRATMIKDFGFIWDLPEAQEKEKQFSISLGGWSRHNTHGKVNRFKEQNPYIGIDIWMNIRLLGGRPFIGYGHVFINSNKGTVDLLMAANEWILVRGKYVDLTGGLGGAYVRYTYPKERKGKPRAVSGMVPMAYLALEKGPVSVRVLPLGKDIIFMYLVYSYR